MQSNPISLLVLCGFAVTAPPAPVQAQLNLNWSAYYAAPGYPTNKPTALLNDSDGNVYVTGVASSAPSSGNAGSASSYSDKWCMLKYNRNGQQLWHINYPGWPGGEAKPVAMTLDALGNVYVTGYVYNSASGNDFMTIKYSARGEQLWARQYDGPGSGDDWARALALDAAGNLYVTGKAWLGSTAWPGGTTADYGFATVKYDPNGNQVWVRYYSPSSGNQDPQALAVDSEGNIYVAGISVFFADPRAPGAGFAVVKYAPDGTQLNVWRYDSFGNGDGTGAKISLALGNSNDVYAAGTMLSSAPPPAFTILKLGHQSESNWVRHYFGPNPYGGKANAVQALAVDGSGNVVVTGSSPGTNQALESATIKLDRAGTLLWAARHHLSGAQDEAARALALDANDNVVVVAAAQMADYSSHLVLMKYAPTGVKCWEAPDAGVVSGTHDPANLAITPQGALLVSAAAAVGSGMEFLTLQCREFTGSVQVLLDGTISVRFPGTPGTTYRFQSSSNLKDWQDVGTAAADSQGVCSFTEAPTPDARMRFYRMLAM